MGQATAAIDNLRRPASDAAIGALAAPVSLIGQLESAAIGRRAAGGAIAVRRCEPAGCFLFGPYLHFAAGAYRLGFGCRSGQPRQADQPVLGVEVIVLSRFQLAWRDYTAAELAAAPASLDFAVPPEHSLEGDNEGRFEFRFFHFGNADLSLSAVELRPLLPDGAIAAIPRRWRLLGRLRKTWIGRRSASGAVAVRRFAPATVLLYGGWPYLRLPRGDYRLIVQARAERPRRPEAPVIGVEVFGQSRWRGASSLMRLARPAAAQGVLLAAREMSAGELAAGAVALDFRVPTGMALEAGADAPIDIRLSHLGNADVALGAVDVVQISGAREAATDALPLTEPIAVPNLRPAGRRKIVIVGNCQCETLRQGFARVEQLNKRFEIKYHYVQLPKNLYEFAASDLESCDILLIQDIRLWDAFPLRDHVRPGAAVMRFPAVRFTSLWPFDAWNGPGDRLAYAREAPNLTFPYLDGLLGRLRAEISDPEARLRAYRALDCPGVVNYRRLHEIELHRLAAMDDKFGCAIGDFIAGNFRTRRIFHTTVRPNWEVFGLLLRYVARLVGVREPIAVPASADAGLRNPQIPVHPKVARDLAADWADERTLYLNRGRPMTWEAYIRGYIAHYG